uniref:Uncharacterized protein n=1 Tax=Oryza glumipatula TaxID=40148 RepID=A0A0D9Y8E6_9ORYZ
MGSDLLTKERIYAAHLFSSTRRSIVEERGKGAGSERSIGGDLSEDTTGEVYDIEYRCSEKSTAKEKGGSGKVYVIGGDLSEDIASEVRGIKYFCSEKSAAEERGKGGGGDLNPSVLEDRRPMSAVNTRVSHRLWLLCLSRFNLYSCEIMVLPFHVLVQVRQDSLVSMVPGNTIIFYSLEIEEIQRSIFSTAAPR